MKRLQNSIGGLSVAPLRDDDPYLIPGTSTLANKLGIEDQAELQLADAYYAVVREQELDSAPLPGSYDFDHFRAFHYKLFCDVYPWAGEPRETNLFKYEFERGGRLSHFEPFETIEVKAREVFGRLAGHEVLSQVSEENFVATVAAHYAAINLLHPFREGNGRATRAFFRQLLAETGRDLSFESVSRERWIRASIEANFGDRDPLERVLAQALDRQALERFRNVEPVLAAMRRDRAFDWQEHYISVPPPGRTFEGRVAIANDRAFVAVAEGRLEIGSSSVLGRTPSVGDDVRYTEPIRSQHDALGMRLVSEEITNVALCRIAIAKDATAILTAKSPTAHIIEDDVGSREITGEVIATSALHAAIATSATSFVIVDRKALDAARSRAQEVSTELRSEVVDPLQPPPRRRRR